jgi:hypothetical protein
LPGDEGALRLHLMHYCEACTAPKMPEFILYAFHSAYRKLQWKDLYPDQMLMEAFFKVSSSPPCHSIVVVVRGQCLPKCAGHTFCVTSAILVQSNSSGKHSLYSLIDDWKASVGPFFKTQRKILSFIRWLSFRLHSNVVQVPSLMTLSCSVLAGVNVYIQSFSRLASLGLLVVKCELALKPLVSLSSYANE